MKFNITIFLAMFMCAIISTKAQFNETIRTGRPGQAIGPFSVGKYVFQTQTGFDIGGNNESDNNSSSNFIAPNTVLRFGLTKYFEINSGLEYRSDKYSINDSTFSTSGFSLTSIGTRINLYEGQSNEPSVGLQLTFKLPIVADAYNSNYISPKILLIANQQIAKDVSFLLNFGLNYNGNTAKPSTMYVANLSYSLSNTWGIFLENYGEFKGNAFENRWDTGIAYLLNDNLQFDTYGGAGYNNNVVDYFVSIGFSWRIITLHN